ncbi:unnamed protein product, partial [Prorocentrum cordatum]
ASWRWDQYVGWGSVTSYDDPPEYPCNVNGFVASLAPGMGYYYDPAAGTGGLCRSIHADNVEHLRQEYGSELWTGGPNERRSDRSTGTTYLPAAQEGAPTPAPSAWVSLGTGICSGHDQDWTSADALGPHWDLHPGLGWRMCDGRSDTQCQQVCDATAGCSMISNGDCCFLFKDDACNADVSHSNYQSYLKEQSVEPATTTTTTEDLTDAPLFVCDFVCAEGYLTCVWRLCFWRVFSCVASTPAGYLTCGRRAPHT